MMIWNGLFTKYGNSIMHNKIILIGGGGHCKSCIDTILTADQYSIEGILDANKSHIKNLSGFPLLGDDRMIPEWVRQGWHFLITVGQIKTADVRIRLYNNVKSADGLLATVVASNAAISRFSVIGEGTIIMQHALLGPGVKVGVNSIINDKALVEHDSIIGDHCHISTGALVNGDCSIRNGVFIGSGTVVNQGVEIGENVVIGSGAVVYKSILEPGVYAGNPAKKI
jgi:sugar O-acyltransferase (sialic acid O-acetyltransferase NeuD family)